MLNKLICCFAALFIFSGLFAKDDNTEKKTPKVTKKERKAAEKAEQNREKQENKVPAAIPELPPEAANWRRGPSRTWEVNLNTAVLKAKAEKKKLYVLASGSDWCPPCKKLKSTVLGNSRFKKIADESFILVFIDFPRGYKLPATQQQHNMIVAKKLNFGKGVPSALIVDPASLKVIGKISGYKPAKEYIKALSKFVSAKGKSSKAAQ